MHKEKIFNRIWKAAGIFLIMLAIAGCKGNEPAPAAETASEDMTVSMEMEMAETAQTAATAAAAEEEPALTLETALVGICLSDSEYGDNERLVPELERSLTSRGFMPENILVKDHTGSRGRQSKQVQECLDRGCSIVIVSPVSDKRIPDIADQISEAGASAIFLNCAPGKKSWPAGMRAGSPQSGSARPMSSSSPTRWPSCMNTAGRTKGWILMKTAMSAHC